MYCEYWQKKLSRKESIDFPSDLARPVAELMNDFSFAYMQEAFVATLLVLARKQEIASNTSYSMAFEGRDPNLYEFYRVIKEQVKILREDMTNGSQHGPDESSKDTCINQAVCNSDLQIHSSRRPATDEASVSLAEYYRHNNLVGKISILNRHLPTCN